MFSFFESSLSFPKIERKRGFVTFRNSAFYYTHTRALIMSSEGVPTFKLVLVGDGGTGKKQFVRSRARLCFSLGAAFFFSDHSSPWKEIELEPDVFTNSKFSFWFCSNGWELWSNARAVARGVVFVCLFCSWSSSSSSSLIIIIIISSWHMCPSSLFFLLFWFSRLCP